MASVTSVYARAFADVVFDMHLDVNRTRAEVDSIAELLDVSKELREVWQSPSIPADQKRRLLDGIVARLGTSKPVRNFIAVLIDRHRIAFLDGIIREFEEELDRRLGFAEAAITSSRQLNASERSGLESRVEKLTGKKVRAVYAEDPALLGGAIVKIGSTIYDGSVRGQLEKIREELVGSS